MPADLSTINTKDHSAYIEITKAHPSTVVKKSVFSIAAYQQVLRLKGGVTSKFNREVGAAFKKLAKGSQVPDTEKVAIDQIMLMCRCENGVNVAYGNPDSFGHPGMMGLWDLHSSNALSQVKMQLASGRVDANFCVFVLVYEQLNPQ